jgi:hypothetical protein
MKILISILITVAIVGYFFYKEMINDYNKDLEELKKDLEDGDDI